MNNQTDEEREQQALDALAAAALREGEERGVSRTEIDEFLKNPVSLSQCGKKALEALGPDVLAKIIDTSPDEATDSSPYLGAPANEPCADFAAMHRKNQTGENEAETEKELERKRQEILKKLKDQKGPKK